MSSRENTARAMPDVATGPGIAGRLDRVGMDAIQMPVLVADASGAVQRIAARVDAAVDLVDESARGIHMSRLYLHLDRHLSAEPLTTSSLRRLLRDFLESHAALSTRADVRIRFEHLVRRHALSSAHSGWRSYPVEIAASLAGGEFAVDVAVSIDYSSTCPASAALARQLIQEQFARDFAASALLDRDAVLAWLGSEQGIVATPHAQRSTADVRVRLAAGAEIAPTAIIDAVEHALGTPVQTAVKREDEQAFTLANGQNLMFCEDAARRIRAVLDADTRIADFRIRATHFESLHPHDAVAVVTKGIDGGFVAG
jgi:GTP cyclohydrolase I